MGILTRRLEHVPLIAQRVPELRIVIDHLGKPPIAAGEFEPWASLLANAAKMPNVFADISGLDCRADNWSAVDVAPYIERGLELFGSERLMFGSDLASGQLTWRLRQGVACDELRTGSPLMR